MRKCHVSLRTSWHDTRQLQRFRIAQTSSLLGIGGMRSFLAVGSDFIVIDLDTMRTAFGSVQRPQPPSASVCFCHSTENPHQHRHRDLHRLPPIEDRIHDLRRKQRQPEHPADVGAVDLLIRRDLPRGRDGAGLQHPPLTERSRERLHHGAVDARARWRPRLTAHRRHDLLPPTAAADREGDAAGQRLSRGAHSAAFRVSAPIVSL